MQQLIFFVSLTPGSQLGPYQLLSRIGAGGMGEVFLARDTQLRRDAAIKVLPASFAGDPSRMTRFRREAQILAMLNHPNIAQIYGMEGNALVMEFVPGDTLQVPLKLADALDIARQIAEALEFAHEKGIVHRDLKPANVKVTPEGLVKVLDFGLAKAMEPDRELRDDISATSTMDDTRPNAVMGTCSYMSPEQASGKPVDRRTDIWAFGVLLTEMLTGRSLFRGASVAETLAQVLTAEISLEGLPPETPGALRELIKRCLDRNLKTRLQSIGEARIALERSLADPSGAVSPSTGAVPARRASRHILLGAALGVATAAIIGGSLFAWRFLAPTPPRPFLRLRVEVGPGIVLMRNGGNNPVAISPDGTRIVVSYRGQDGKAHLGTRLLQQDTVFPLNGTDNATAPFFSPDGQWIGFFADAELKKVSIDGASLNTLCAVRNPRGASWGDDGNIVLSAGLGEPLSQVSAQGGELKPLTRFKGKEHTHRWPQVLPGSRYVLFTSSDFVGNYDDARIALLDRKTGDISTLHQRGSAGRYLPDPACALCGRLVYLQGSTLFAAPFDLSQVKATGPFAPFLEDVSTSPITGGDFIFSSTGVFAYIPGRAARAGGPLQWLDSNGKQADLHPAPGQYFTPRISPDGKRLAFAIGTPADIDIWIQDLASGTLSRAAALGGQSRYPVWTPDGQAIVFRCLGGKSPGLYWVRADGTGEPVRLTDGENEDVPFSFSPDGKRIAFYRWTANGSQIRTAPLIGDANHGDANHGDANHPQMGPSEIFFETQAVAMEPMFSPDGHWLAYTSNDSGTPQIYVRSYPGPGGKWQVTSGGGVHFPNWSRSGHELLFERLGEVGVMAMTYTTSHSSGGETFSAGPVRVWSDTPLLDSNNFPNYDLAPDGKRIAALLAPADAGERMPLTHVTFLLNFLDELKRRDKRS